jgi:hypothetical protein
LGLRGQNVGGGVFADCQQPCGSVRRDKRKTGTSGVDSNVEAQFYGDAGAGDTSVDGRTGFQQNGVRDGRAGHEERGSACKQIKGKTNSVTWAHRSPLRTKEMARDEPPLKDYEKNTYQELLTMLLQSDETAKLRN